MTMLDRFRTQTRDKDPDPLVRLAFLEEIPLTERATIAAIAREDEDPKVRKAAVAKLMAPTDLAAIICDDRDEQVRAQAAAMLRDIALESFEEIGEAESFEAVDQTADTRSLAHIAKSAARESVALRALARVDDPHALGSIARLAVAEAARRQAFAALSSRGERAELLAVALNSEFKDTAVAAVDLVTERTVLDQIIARGKNKSAVKRARGIVREAEEQAAREAAEVAAAQLMAAIETSPAVVEPLADLASPPHGDPLASQVAGSVEIAQTPEEAEARRQRQVQDTEARAQALAEAAEAAAVESARRQLRLAELAEEATAAVAELDYPVARKRFHAIRREWRVLSTDISVQDTLAATYIAADVQMTTREHDAQAADTAARRDALVRIHHLLGRVEPIAAKGDLTLKAADRALRDVRTALSSMPPLPTKQDFEEVHNRLKAVQATLTPKITELREADDWKRFANVSIQEQLCARMEALKTVEDLEAAGREVRELQQQWRAAADVPRAQADALWRRFKTAHDEVWARCEAFFAVQNAQRTENMAKKVALCERAEALAESTQWIQTADEIKTLQAEWKTIGPVSRGKEKAIWDRFRALCDRFFTRRHDDLAVRKASWTDNLAKKDALCARAEALAQSTDWDAAGAEIKQLQADWKAIGPVKKSRSEAIWQRFRGACDTFFARYAQRHDTARAERVTAREALCAEIEALAASDTAANEAPTALANTTRGLRSRWQSETAARGVEPDTARRLDERFTAAFNAIVTRFPAAFAGSDLDPDANRARMETIVGRVEELASSLSGPAPADASVSPTNRLAAMLKEALATNTIGGKADEDARVRAAAEEARQAQAAWARVGDIPEETRRRMADRFQRALRVIADRAAKVGPAPHAAETGRSSGGSGVGRGDGRGDGRRDGRGGVPGKSFAGAGRGPGQGKPPGRPAK